MLLKLKEGISLPLTYKEGRGLKRDYGIQNILDGPQCVSNLREYGFHGFGPKIVLFYKVIEGLLYNPCNSTLQKLGLYKVQVH